ncbi:uncharacterized protein LOC114537267 [Dendronephthya gigantea]|uniref:uncharacterized protein LOC114537267 n=1 Tax=Dendronephthya gigantea TaxID=151771 RepID=UPI00106C9887|nr:uncharacterized protein LOC114537267 [Dendronephthya gigantea]
MEDLTKIIFKQTLLKDIHLQMIFLLSFNRFGPLIRSWCMRYEAKHHYFKRLAIVLGNFINISYSLAKRHQEGVCYRLQSAEGGQSSFIDKGIETGPGKVSHVGDSDFCELIKAEACSTERKTPLYKAKWISIHGTKYKVGAVLHVGFDSDEFPQFCEIVEINVVNNNLKNPLFVVSEKETVRFSDHYQAYEIAPSVQKRNKVVYFKEFTSHLPLNLIKPFGRCEKFVCLRYEMVNL